MDTIKDKQNIKNPVIIILTIIITLLVLIIICAFTLTAPNVKTNNNSMAFTTAEKATTKTKNQLENQKIKINNQTFTAKELGITYNEQNLKKDLQNSKIINFSKWNNNITPTITINEQQFNNTISQKIPEYITPTNSNITYNQENQQWEIIPSTTGNTINKENLIKQITQNIKENTETTINLEQIEPKITNETSQNFANILNEQSTTAKLTNNDNTLLSLTQEEYNNLITIKQTENNYTITPNNENIDNFVNTLPERLNNETKPGTAIVDENGKILKTVEQWTNGFKIGNLNNIKKTIKTTINENKNVFKIDGEYTPAQIDKKFRKAIVNKSERMVYLYENDKLIEKLPAAIGKSSTPTHSGEWRVYTQLESQDMGCNDPSIGYCQPNVPWVSYFNGGEGFHGTYWHSDFGNTNSSMVSHGCVNLSIPNAEKVYRFLQNGSPVTVQE